MLSPLRLLILIAIAWLAARRWRLHWLRAPLLGAAVVMIVLTTPFGGNLLVRLLESRVPASACAAPHPRTIVLLSSGVVARPVDEHQYGVLDLASLQRLFGAIDLFRTSESSQLVIFGTSDRGIADSRILAELARSLGIDGTALRTEGASLTTWQNAQAAAAMQPPLPRNIWLVTSALHMPRAAYAFREAGFEVCAYPVQPLYKGFDGIGYFLPTGSAVVKAEDALHEIVGEIAYRLHIAREQPPPVRE